MSPFTIKIHTFPGQHLREYPGVTRHKEEDVQYLEAKQYIPKANTDLQPGDVTILAAVATGFPKELYEPMWEELLSQSQKAGFRIRSIWIMDPASQGNSYVLNEHTAGTEMSYFDIARDTLQMVNTFRQEFPQPIVGIGHSMGGPVLMEVSRMHPRLFASMTFIDPVIGDIGNSGAMLMQMAGSRPDLWPDHQTAEAFFRKGLKRWDFRVVDLFLKYGLRDTPTLVHRIDGKVTLRTTKALESNTYGRAWFDEPIPEGKEPSLQTRAKYPDFSPVSAVTHPFYKPEFIFIWEDLPRLRPPTLYVAPEASPMTTQRALRGKVEKTGTGMGGSGGEKMGRVVAKLVKGGHLVPFEDPAGCAQPITGFISESLQWWHEARQYAQQNPDDTNVDKLVLSETWLKRAQEYYCKNRSPAKASRGSTKL